MKMMMRILLPVGLLAVIFVKADWFKNDSNDAIAIEVFKGTGSHPRYQKREGIQPGQDWNTRVVNINRIVLYNESGSAEYKRADNENLFTGNYKIKNGLKLYNQENKELKKSRS